MAFRVLLILCLSFQSFASQMPSIYQEWQTLAQQVKAAIAKDDGKKAAEFSQKLLAIDPADDEAKFYLHYSYLLTKEGRPGWVKNEIQFSNTDEGDFYKALLLKVQK